MKRKLPLYEVAFLPLERRLAERRRANREVSGYRGPERRVRDRRSTPGDKAQA